jgi:hypothetical protein
MKTMKIITAFALTLILSGQVMAKQATTATADQKDQLVVPLSEPGKPYKLHVGLINGSIKVIGYEGKDIIIDITSEDKRKTKDRGESGGMKRITAGNGMDVTVQEKNNAVTINTDSWKGSVNLVIKVPSTQATMHLSCINDGDLVVDNVSGEFEVSNSNGGVTMTNISGSAVVSALNHNIKVSFKSVDPKAAMSFASLNGNIDVTFPATFKANVKLKTDRGDMYTDFDLDADKTQPAPKKTNDGKTYRISLENWVYGKIGGGGPELMMKNMNGNIYIRKAKQ